MRPCIRRSAPSSEEARLLRELVERVEVLTALLVENIRVGGLDGAGVEVEEALGRLNREWEV